MRGSERGGIECSPTVAAELFPDEHRDSTLRAGEGQSGSAFFAKLGLIPITDSTFCALHEEDAFQEKYSKENRFFPL